MRRLAALAAAALCLATAAEAAPKRWTFCIVASDDGSDVWISDVFPAEDARFKAAFNSAVEKLGLAGADARCPTPREDKSIADNARIDAEAFHRKLGASIHAARAAALSAEGQAGADRRLIFGSGGPAHANR